MSASVSTQANGARPALIYWALYWILYWALYLRNAAISYIFIGVTYAIPYLRLSQTPVGVESGVGVEVAFDGTFGGLLELFVEYLHCGDLAVGRQFLVELRHILVHHLLKVVH